MEPLEEEEEEDDDDDELLEEEPELEERKLQPLGEHEQVFISKPVQGEGQSK